MGSSTSKQSNAVLQLAKTGNLEEINKLLLSNLEVVLNAQDESGNSVLHIAAKEGHYDMLKSLLSSSGAVAVFFYYFFLLLSALLHTLSLSLSLFYLFYVLFYIIFIARRSRCYKQCRRFAASSGLLPKLSTYCTIID